MPRRDPSPRLSSLQKLRSSRRGQPLNPSHALTATRASATGPPEQLTHAPHTHTNAKPDRPAKRLSSTYRYQSTKDEQAALRMRLKELAASRVRNGYRRLHVLLRRESWQINAKRVYRLYREENLALRTRTPRRRGSCRKRMDRLAATRINDCWAMDFMTDELFDGRRIRLLTIFDHFTRESLAIVVGQRLRGHDVVAALALIGLDRPLPKTIRVDNVPEFTSKALRQWAYANEVTLDFSRPGKPTDNAFIESFNGRCRAECLNENWFLSLEEAQKTIEAWRQDYSNHRPHSSLDNLAPENSLDPARQPTTDKALDFHQTTSADYSDFRDLNGLHERLSFD